MQKAVVSKPETQRPTAAIKDFFQLTVKGSSVSEPFLSQSPHLSQSPQNQLWHREKHHVVNGKGWMSNREEINVCLCVCVCTCMHASGVCVYVSVRLCVLFVTYVSEHC